MVSNWMVENKLKPMLINDKTHLLTFRTQERLIIPGSKVSVMMDNHQLRESEDKYEVLLGCKIEGNLKWHRQAEYLASKLGKRI